MSISVYKYIKPHYKTILFLIVDLPVLDAIQRVFLLVFNSWIMSLVIKAQPKLVMFIMNRTTTKMHFHAMNRKLNIRGFLIILLLIK